MDGLRRLSRSYQLKRLTTFKGNLSEVRFIFESEPELFYALAHVGVESRSLHWAQELARIAVLLRDYVMGEAELLEGKFAALRIQGDDSPEVIRNAMRADFVELAELIRAQSNQDCTDLPGKRSRERYFA